MTAVVSPGVGAGRDPDPGPDPAPRPREPEPSRRRRVSPLAIVLTTVPVLVAAAGVYAIATHKFSPQPFRATYQVPATFNLRQGDCFNLDHNDRSVSLLPCSSPHDAEVFATFTLPAQPWPGVHMVQSQADAGCAARVSGYLGTTLTPNSLSRNATYPDSVTWQAGVRTVICTIGSADGGKTIGSFRQPAPSATALAVVVRLFPPLEPADQADQIP
ncbi:MAG TPA: septum formation family protein [Streptosporangiaceae bacterium]|nr:septum formation family protein [Streptosporangiaceae bacterium]